MNLEDFTMEMVTSEPDDADYVTEIIKFLKTDAGKYMLGMIESTKQNRIKDLIYADKETIFGYQGEVVACDDILCLLSEESLKVLREELLGNE